MTMSDGMREGIFWFGLVMLLLLIVGVMTNEIAGPLSQMTIGK